MSEKFRTARAVVVSVALTLVAAGGVAYAAEQLPKNSVTSKAIKNGAVAAKDLKNGAATRDKIAPGAVTADKIAPGAVSAGKLGEASVTPGALSPAAKDLFVSSSQVGGVTESANGCITGEEAGCSGALLDFGATSLDYRCFLDNGFGVLTIRYSDGDENVVVFGHAIYSNGDEGVVRLTGDQVLVELTDGFATVSGQLTVSTVGESGVVAGSVNFSASVEQDLSDANCDIYGLVVYP
jgi:hypothetical protein